MSLDAAVQQGGMLPALQGNGGAVEATLNTHGPVMNGQPTPVDGLLYEAGREANHRDK
ncbi:hypothetical protein FRC17_003321 [Serendipita sp. 399]|nr:hypothetical protein FRC17_003321 [Serendipita sp. 399]